MTKQLAIITGEDAPKLTSDGKALTTQLQKQGYSTQPVHWTNPDIDWNQFDAAILRSCWNYYRQPHEFQELIDTIEHSNATLLNRPDIVRWNLHKSYLSDLQTANINTIPTEVITDTESTELKPILETNGWDEAVVKPIIGTSAAGVWKTTKQTATSDQERFENGFRAARRVGDGAAPETDGERLSDRGAIIQPFIPEVGNGELSLVFFNGEYSHAWKSIRAPQELGVQPTIDENKPGYTPDPSVIEFASNVLNTTSTLLDHDPADMLYARVDCVKRNGDPYLMEVELIEPHLNLTSGETAVEDFATAITTTLEQPHPHPS